MRMFHPEKNQGLRVRGILCLGGLILLGLFGGGAAFGGVTLIRTPDGGIQSQAAVDARGVVQIIYFKGEAQGGDIFYVRRGVGEKEFSKPLRVNTNPRTAMAVGTIRGAQLAVGKNGRAHVVWNGMGEGTAGGGEKPERHPLFYARLNDAGTVFEPERNVITYAYGLDGGSSVAADPLGNVYVAWHAPVTGNTNGEAGRAVFISRSADEGKTLQRETMALAKPTGACACCGMRAFADSAGAVCIMFRSAGEKVNRDEMLTVSPKPGAPFQGEFMDRAFSPYGFLSRVTWAVGPAGMRARL